MKHILTLSLIFLSLLASAKEITTNPKTNLTLNETAGVYSISSKTGVIITGDINDTRDFLKTVNDCITKESLSSIVTFKNQEYKVGKDDTGYYVFKVGLGAVKIRLSDSTLFLLKLDSILLKNHLSSL